MSKRRNWLWLVVAVVVATGVIGTDRDAAAAPPGQPSDWQRFYYYPYVYYPHNFTLPQTYDHMYYRYPVDRRIPVYNKDWHNFYPSERPYHSGKHFYLDVL